LSSGCLGREKLRTEQDRQFLDPMRGRLDPLMGRLVPSLEFLIGLHDFVNFSERISHEAPEHTFDESVARIGLLLELFGFDQDLNGGFPGMNMSEVGRFEFVRTAREIDPPHLLGNLFEILRFRGLLAIFGQDS